jgi:glycosyltransferase 2 family protein
MAEQVNRKKRWFFTVLIVAVLAALAYMQFRTWRKFDWSVFLEQTRQADWRRIVFAVAIIYGTYVLRALRWAIMLRPVKRTEWIGLIQSQFIGFTGLAILGRPGEFIRPYLIARQEQLSFASQIAVWTVERIFDMGCFALLVAFDLIFAPSLRDLPYFNQFRDAGFVLAGFIFLVGLAAFLIWRNGDGIAAWLDRFLSPRFPNIAKTVCEKVTAFGDGLHTIHDLRSFFELLFVSLGLWLAIGYAYLQITRAYPEPLRHMELTHVLLLMGFSIAGSAVQLPMVGGGSQLATIAALVNVFNVPNELAVSCGVLLWLVTFVAATPVGLALSRRAHLSLIRLSKEASPPPAPVPSGASG